MLRPGGTVIHIVPCNGWVNHGFYQISPTLMFDYYQAAGFEPLLSALHSRDLVEPDRSRIVPIRAGDLGDGLAGSIQDGVHLFIFAARRGESVIERPRPTQWLYSASGAPRPRVPWFLPYTIDCGTKHDAAITTNIAITGAVREGGHCWSIPLPELMMVADGEGYPTQSPLIVLEDGDALGPTHSAHQKIRQIGAGAYSHWNDTLYFSTSDNTDPSINGRRYTAIVLEYP